MHTKEATELQKLVIESAQHVLPACGLAIGDLGDPSPGAEDPKQVVAFMGFTGDVLRGTLTLVAPLEVLRAAYPLPLDVNGHWQLDVFDWTGEIANRLLGRIKLALTARGADVEASTPRVMLGEHLHVSRSTKGTVCAAAFRVGPSAVRVWFDAVAAEGRDLFTVSAEAAPDSLPEGDVLLFD